MTYATDEIPTRKIKSARPDQTALPGGTPYYNAQAIPSMSVENQGERKKSGVNPKQQTQRREGK
jgi:hypothetical protein